MKNSRSILEINRSESFIKAVENALDGNHSEFSLESDDRTYHIAVNPVLNSENVSGVIIIILDATETEKREQLLQHCLRKKNYDAEKFGMACDIVVNSNILLEYNMNPDSILLRRYGGIMPHIAPDGKEGYEYTAEQVYQMLKTMDSDETEPDDSDSQDGNKSDSTDSDCNNSDNGDGSGNTS